MADTGPDHTYFFHSLLGGLLGIKSKIHSAKPIYLFFQYVLDQKGSGFNHNFILIIQSRFCKHRLIDPMHF